jgi:NAD(P)H-dependent flavin oxidoreductase YrpB (nitropropane dioxygenase family)
VIHKCTAVRHALKAQSIGCDAVSVDGFECGGHPGEDDVPNLILLPRAADELDIPFVSSGGQADGRSLVASLALGAEGMNMGTRFIATKEAPGAPERERRDRCRVRTRHPPRHAPASQHRARAEQCRRGACSRRKSASATDSSSKTSSMKSPASIRSIMVDGDMDAGAWSCGMVAGLIHDIPTCKELIDRIMAEAEDIITKRLTGFLNA